MDHMVHFADCADILNILKGQVFDNNAPFDPSLYKKVYKKSSSSSTINIPWFIK